jgi:hypothetical protein
VGFCLIFFQGFSFSSRIECVRNIFFGHKMNAALLAAAVAIAAVQPRAAAFVISAASTHELLRWAPSRANPTSVPIPRRSNLAKVSGGGGLRARAAGAGEFTVLVEWLCARGGFVHTSLALAEDDGGAGRGLVATRAVRKGEQMIVVPRAAQLRVPQANEDAQLLALIDAVKPTPHLRILNIPLALRLLQEKCRPASEFDPYLRMLPASYDAMPDYYAQHIPELQFSNVEQRAVARIKELVRLTGALAARAGAGALSGASVDIGAVMWACGTASSRGFGLPWPAGGPLYPVPRAAMPGVGLAHLHLRTPRSPRAPMAAFAVLEPQSPVLLFPCRTREEGPKRVKEGGWGATQWGSARASS